MNPQKLSDPQIADLCRSLSLLLHSRVAAADGLFLMAEEERDPHIRAMLETMAHGMDDGLSLSQVFRQTNRFPQYITGLLHVGQEVGKTEETLLSLADHCETQERLRRQIINSLTYPALLLLLMLVVIVVLLSQVIPIFNEIYLSLGGQLRGIAHGLLLLGQLLDRALPVLCSVLCVLFFGAAVLYLHPASRQKLYSLWQKKWGDRGIARQLNNARFAQALSMGFSSGMVLEDSVELASDILSDCPGALQRCVKCREQLLQGSALSDALGKNGLLSPSACRQLALGIRSGSGDRIMEQIAGRMHEEALFALESAVSKIEPALVLITSALVGVILLSVMLPLMNIMTAIG